MALVKSKAEEEGGVTFLTLDDKATILETVEKQVAKGGRPITHCVKALATKLGKNEITVWRYLKKMRDTTAISRSLIRASAYKLTKRIIEKADVDQSMDLLSRPNIGVLEPLNKSGSTGGGLFISISADNCGAVNVGTAASEPKRKPNDILDLSLDDYELDGGSADATWPKREVSDEGEGPLGLPRWEGDLSEEHGDGEDPHPGRVQVGARGRNREGGGGRIAACPVPE